MQLIKRKTPLNKVNFETSFSFVYIIFMITCASSVACRNTPKSWVQSRPGQKAILLINYLKIRYYCIADNASCYGFTSQWKSKSTFFTCMRSSPTKLMEPYYPFWLAIGFGAGPDALGKPNWRDKVQAYPAIIWLKLEIF